MENIFDAIKVAKQVGNLVSSMQTPDVDEAVLARAINGSACASAVVLTIIQCGDEETRNYTVAELQTAEREDKDTWLLTTGETLWVYY